MSVFDRLGARAAGVPTAVRVRVPHPFERVRRGDRNPVPDGLVADLLAGRPQDRGAAPPSAAHRTTTSASPAAPRGEGRRDGARTGQPAGPDPGGARADGAPARAGGPRSAPAAGREGSVDGVPESLTTTSGTDRTSSAPDRREPAAAPGPRRDPEPGRRPGAPAAPEPAVPGVGRTRSRTDAAAAPGPSGLDPVPDLADLVRRTLSAELSARGLAGRDALVVTGADVGTGSDRDAVAAALAAVPAGTRPGATVVAAAPAAPAPGGRPAGRRDGTVDLRVDRVVVVEAPRRPAPPAPQPPAPRPVAVRRVDHDAYLARRREDR